MSYGQPCNRMTGGPSVGPSSAYPTLSRPASTCLRAGNEVPPALVGGAAGGVEEHAAAEVAATAATPIASETSRLVIMCGPSSWATCRPPKILGLANPLWSMATGVKHPLDD